jgi:hypothetical protein
MARQRLTPREAENKEQEQAGGRLFFSPSANKSIMSRNDKEIRKTTELPTMNSKRKFILLVWQDSSGCALIIFTQNTNMVRLGTPTWSYRPLSRIALLLAR